MKRCLPFILPLLATSAFAHVPDPVLSTTLKSSQLSTLNSHAYTYLTGGQRATQARTDASSVTYNYDAIGQLKKALGTGGQSTENLGFGYDAAWNLSKRTNGAAIQTFNVDGKNQMTSVPDGACVYDANGNLTSAKGGLQKFGYDEENRLVAFTNYLSVTKPDARTAFYYDGLSRLRVRREYAWVPDNNPGGAAATGAGVMSPGGGTWQLSSETRYVYDGRRVIQERNGSNTPLVSYTRGQDLSGSLEGAGGIGGLLGRSHGYSAGNWSTHNFYHADGAGNVTYMLAANQTLAASYRYDPYGNTTYSSGSLAAANVYRFSSKELLLNSGLYTYGYRFYSPNWQRWLNQDPIGLRGGINLFAYVGNDPVNRIDPMGLYIQYTTDDGVSTSFGEQYSDLIRYLQRAIDHGEHVTELRISGHGDDNLISLDPYGNNILTSTATAILTGDGQDITQLLNKALAPNADIYLNGCHTARGKDNLAQQMSLLLPGRQVAGQLGFAVGLTGNLGFNYHGERYEVDIGGLESLPEGKVFGRKAYYQNGNLIGKGWLLKGF